MSKIKFDQATLLPFLKSLALKGEIENKEVLLDVEKQTIKALIVSSNKTLAVRGVLKGTFDAVGKVGVTNFSSFIRFVESQDSDFTGEFLKNRLALQSKTSRISIVLQNAEYIYNKLDNDKFEKVLGSVSGDVKFTIPYAVVQELIRKFEILPSEDLVLESKEGALSLYVKDYQTESELFADYEIEELKKQSFSVKVSNYFILILKTLATDVVIEVKKENPTAIGISVDNKNGMSLEYLLALKVKEEAVEAPAKAKKSKKDEA